MTKQELIAKIVELGGEKPKAKTSKVELEATLEQLTAKPTKRHGSSKDSLRALFMKNGFVTREDVARIADQLGVKLNSVETALVDLKNPKWAGGPVISHNRDEQGRYIAA